MELENSEAEINVENKQRRRRRSSFFNKSRANLDRSDVKENDNNSSATMSSGVMVDNSWKEVYLQNLNQEMKDWSNLKWDMKYKYQESVKKSSKTKLIDSSCLKLLPIEQRDFLNKRGIHEKLIEQTNNLIESVAINEKLQDIAVRTFNNFMDHKKTELTKMNRKIYKETIETPYIEGNIDYIVCEDSDSEPPRILFDDSGIED